MTAARLQKFTLNRRLNGEALTELLALELVPLRIHHFGFILIFYYRTQNKQFHLFKARKVIGLLANE